MGDDQQVISLLKPIPLLKRCLSYAPKSLGALSLALLPPARLVVCRMWSRVGGSGGQTPGRVLLPPAGKHGVTSMVSRSVRLDNVTCRAIGYCNGPLVPVNTSIAGGASAAPFSPVCLVASLAANIVQPGPCTSQSPAARASRCQLGTSACSLRCILQSSPFGTN